MKKTILSLLTLLVLSLGSTQAQTKLFIQPGVSAGVDKVAHEDLELGFDGGKNRISVTGNTYRGNASSERQYLLGVKYARSLPLLSSLNGLLSLGAKTNVDNVSAYVIEPGVGVEWKLNPNVGFITGLTSPVTQSSFKARTASFSGNIALKINLN